MAADQYDVLMLGGGNAGMGVTVPPAAGLKVAMADRVVNGAGRIADVDGLELAAGNVKHDRGGGQTEGPDRTRAQPGHVDRLSAKTFAETVAWSKVIVDEASDRILGAHMVGHAGEELIHLFAFAMMYDRHSKPAPRLRVRLPDLLR